MHNTKHLKNILEVLHEALLITTQWDAKPVIDMEEQKKVSDLLTQALSNTWAMSSTHARIAIENQQQLAEQQVLEAHKQDLRNALSDLRNELHEDKPENPATSPAEPFDNEMELELDTEKTMQKPQPATQEKPAEVSPHFLSDMYATHGENDTALATPIDSLRKAIGISDKFLFIKELFHDDTAEFQRAIDLLDGLNSLEDAQARMQVLLQHIDTNNDAYKQLGNLLVRRYKTAR
jgi:chaperonin cofactor prefoldin